MLRIFLMTVISNASCQMSFSKLKLIKNYIRSAVSQLRLTNLAILTIEQDIMYILTLKIKDFELQKHAELNSI
nr:unnamed protein product [Callosobruchus chinensis]